MSPEDPLLVRKLGRRVPRTKLREFLEEVTRRVAHRRAVVCLITDDREMRALNRRFLGKDRTTDVLSFPATDHANGLGEIAISIDRAAEQASGLGHSLTDELRVLMLHGVLHLAGFDHESDSGQMARAEARWRNSLGLPAGLIERSGDARVAQGRSAKGSKSRGAGSAKIRGDEAVERTMAQPERRRLA